MRTSEAIDRIAELAGEREHPLTQVAIDAALAIVAAVDLERWSLAYVDKWGDGISFQWGHIALTVLVERDGLAMAVGWGDFPPQRLGLVTAGDIPVLLERYMAEVAA